MNAHPRRLPWLTPAMAGGMIVLLALSLVLRSTALHAPFWIDEGLSVGIASHPFADIPSVLRQDGSPPLYYLLLSVWMHVFSDGQATTHVLSLVFGLLSVPAGWWAGRSLFDARAGWFTAILAAVNPFLTYYSQETRMYSLLSLVSLIVVALFAHVFGRRHRGHRYAAGVAVAALAYTHNWGLFVAAATVLAVLIAWRAAENRRAVLEDAAVIYAIAGVLYAPWLPSLAFQAAHTGAPWSERPSLTDVFGPLTSILGGQAVPLGLLMAAAHGLSRVASDRIGPAEGDGPDGRAARRVVWILIAVPATGLALAWLSSQASPAFTGRYFAVLLGPLLLLAGIGLSRAGGLGLACLAIVFVIWLDPRTSEIDHKSDARVVAARIEPHVRAGDLAVSVHPEQAPLLHYYFKPGLRYATSLGMMPDPQVFDWRDALQRLRDADPYVTLNALLRTLRPGQRLVLVLPIIRTSRWGAPWTKLVRERSAQWEIAADRNAGLRRLMAEPRFGHGRLPRGVRAVIYERT